MLNQCDDVAVLLGKIRLDNQERIQRVTVFAGVNFGIKNAEIFPSK
jgi:hypothetical protein